MKVKFTKPLDIFLPPVAAAGLTKTADKTKDQKENWRNHVMRVLQVSCVPNDVALL